MRVNKFLRSSRDGFDATIVGPDGTLGDFVAALKLMLGDLSLQGLGGQQA